MKLLRYGDPGSERPAILDAAGVMRDVSAVIPDITGATLDDDTLNHLRRLDPDSFPPVPGKPRIGPCVGQVGKFCCIGLNYTDHAEEMNMAIPEHPVLFLKANSSISGPNDPVVMPRGSEKTDWEIELGLVIGTRAKYVTPETALNHVAGFCIINDVTERHFQSALSGQWTKGKSCDSFGPIGPWLVTRDEVPDVQALGMRLTVNGVERQSGNTRTMIFTVAECIAHLSQLFTLEPGDVISTGTPPGIGAGRTPPIFLREGDEMVLEIDGLGTQRQKVVADR
ncbi:fumarylacetoacetate hydrolase family protein [Cognatishimia sp. F0-27]|uniref:fumarylacetoacetate hydrolase family protein n=1 Tax=Cognatishimia sp. F0-27 TaxID=2816855 RepID=UPI001D0CADAA|nr:fumarylacetoacetate hydrolase family protein [Cognatishimia sp. F0-27]MCC1494861.1 fumarylacetoacetate hydrolase family protein [Cognatishimia sp. F0-27]